MRKRNLFSSRNLMWLVPEMVYSSVICTHTFLFTRDSILYTVLPFLIQQCWSVLGRDRLLIFPIFFVCNILLWKQAQKLKKNSKFIQIQQLLYFAVFFLLNLFCEINWQCWDMHIPLNSLVNRQVSIYK